MTRASSLTSIVLGTALLAATTALKSKPENVWIHVDTWFDVPHSYSIVGSNLAAALHGLRFEEKVRVTVGESQPLYQPAWKIARKESLSSLSGQVPRHQLQQRSNSCPDVVFRVAFPFNLSLPRHCLETKLLMHVTAETGRVWDIFQNTEEFTPWAELGANAQIKLVSPSAWSAKAFSAAGSPALVVPHGFGGHLRGNLSFREKLEARKDIGMPLDCVVLLTIGAMTPNKGLPSLLQALHSALHRLQSLSNDEQTQCIKLIIKAPAAVYADAEARVRAAVHAAGHGSLLQVVFHGATLSQADMARLYAAADLYVTPYSAEGFNMPALEAAAVGVPVVATGVGPVPEFLPPTVARFIDARMVKVAGQPEMFPLSCPQGGSCAEIMLAELNSTHFTNLLASTLAGIIQLRTGQLQSIAPRNAQCPFDPAACALCLGNATCVRASVQWLQQVHAGGGQAVAHLTWSAAAQRILNIARDWAFAHDDQHTPTA